MQFIAAGLRAGERAVIAVFEEKPDAYLARSRSVGVDFHEAVENDNLRIIYLRPLDLSVDETLEEIRIAVEETPGVARRDRLDHRFEMARPRPFARLPESLYG